MNCSPPGSSIHGDSPGKNTGVGDLPNPGIEPMSPALLLELFTNDKVLKDLKGVIVLPQNVLNQPTIDI